jgi:glutamate/tyrosine decarboxylase-like PLP-dependent enzyme
MAQICQKYSIHFHVDAAWGGPLIFSPDHRFKLNGIQYADSITIDGHKQLFTPMGLGVLLLKSPKLAISIQKSANYIIRAESSDIGKFTLEGSRPANSLFLHASLSLLGKNGMNVLITRSCSLVQQLYSRVLMFPSGCFQALHTPHSNIFLFRYVPVQLRGKIKEKVALDKEENDIVNGFVVNIQQRLTKSQFFISRTKAKIDGAYQDAFRVVIANPLTEWEHIDACLMKLATIGQECEKDWIAEKRNEIMLKNMGINEWWAGWPFDM